LLSSDVLLGEQAVLWGELIEPCCSRIRGDVRMNLANLAKLRTGFALVLLLVLMGSLMWQFNVQSARATQKTIIVPVDYPTIGEAVANASPGDTVFVKSGTYHENVLIDKSLLIVGEDSANTVVIGEGGVNGGNVITLAANNVTVTGFTVKSADYNSVSQYANGINVKGDNCTVRGNNIENTFWGVLCAIQSFTLITENNITDNFKEGIRFYGGSYNTISGNFIAGNKASGIAMEGYSNVISRNVIRNNTRAIGLGASYSVVFANVISDNSESGIYFVGSNNTVTANQISDDGWGIYFPPYFAAPNGNKIYHNNFVNVNQNVYVTSVYNINYWDNVAEGNYWSSYAAEYPNAREVDNSGTGDTPYVICANNTDNHPLIEPYATNKASTPPTAEQPPMAKDHVVALWHFDEVEPNLVTPDAMGLNNGILGSTSGNISFTPSLVAGKFGNALSFDGWSYVYVPPSPSLKIRNEITIDAWVYFKEFKNVAYSNIAIQALREDKGYPNRIAGLAVNGMEPENSTSPVVGALRGYVVTDTEGFNEIVTTEAVIHLNEWTHVVFTRSLTSGMHLYVNGEEKAVRVTAGKQNPTGTIKRNAILYIGHDSNAIIDELSISNIAKQNLETFLWMQWWSWVAIAAGALIAVVAGVLFYFKKRRQ
jgi:parallel beta-helix repeat protein